MRNDRVNYVLVGGFVLAMIAALVMSIAMLTGRTGVTDTYYTRYADATGLKFGSQVLYMGYPVGQVEDIRPVLEDGRIAFEIELAIAREFAHWNVPRDSEAQVRAAGLLAAVTIDIRAGQSSEPLKPGDRIRGVARPDVFGAVSETADTVRELTLTSLKPLLENLNHYVSGFGQVLESRGGPLVDNLSALSGEMASRAPEVIDEFLATTRGVRQVSARLEAVLSEDNARKLGSVVDNVLAASEDMAELSGNARAQLARILDDESTARVRQVVANLDLAGVDLAATSARARGGVDTVLSDDNVARLERALVNAEEASAAARDLVSPARVGKLDTTLESTQRAAADLEAMIGETRAGLSALVGPEIVRRFDEALANISRAAVNVAELSAHLDRRVGDVLTADVATKLGQALRNFAVAADHVASLTRDLRETRRELDGLLAALRGMAEDNRADVCASVRDLRFVLGTVAQHIDAVAQDLEGASRNMLEFSRRLKANPGLLLRGEQAAPEALEGG